MDGIWAAWHLKEEEETGNKPHKASTKQEISVDPTKKLPLPAR